MSISQRTIALSLADGTAASAYVAVPESGSGPGLLLLHDRHGLGDHAKHQANLYAEEGWVVLSPDLYARQQPRANFAYDDAGNQAATLSAGEFDTAAAIADAGSAVAALRALPEVTGECGVLGHDIGGLLAFLLAASNADVACAVAYDAPGLENFLDQCSHITVPTVVHVAADDAARTAAGDADLRAAGTAAPQLDLYIYDAVAPGFDNGNNTAYNRPAQMMAKSRTLACLRENLGPVYDLAALWDAHLYSEFAERDVDVSMDTMVDDPYVLVVPTITGGTGKKNLHRWYSNHFHFQNPQDTRIVPISRTIGSDRLIDEFIFSFTHDRIMDWILPGVAATGKTIEIPMMAVVNFRGAKLYHEHIWWDQASVLVQAGLLDPQGLPVTGAEQAAAMQDECLPRNRLIPGWE